MTHPIVEGLTEAITMAKLMRENEQLRRELAEERALCDRYAKAFRIGENDGVIMRPALVKEADRAYRNKRGEG